MVTKYSENPPPEPRRVKVYSRTGPFVSNPTYGRTTASLTTVRHFLPETRLKPCGISRPLLSAPISGSYNHPEGVAGAKKKHLHACSQAALQQIQRFRMSNKRGMFMMAHFRVSGYEYLRSCESISRRKLTFHLHLQEFPGQRNQPGGECRQNALHAGPMGARALLARLTIH